MASRVKGVENAPHVIGTGENRVLLVLPDVYDGIGTNLGVVKLVGDPPAGVPSTTVGRAIAEGLIRKIKVSYMDGTKRKTATLVVAGDKAGQARATLTGKTYRTKLIKTAYYPTSITLG
ncbi:hypothetical protein [Nostoc sp. GT001]|uniref:hypothetical protein n=1 Tax=Nostoc sp. GT001 TaxID=3056647 RepID=UPI0025AA6517|nr:hypothetical protein [Nostoc sp. GT001]MDM9582316.1 hypothetical protein [Nostoc sp. GT001]